MIEIQKHENTWDFVYDNVEYLIFGDTWYQWYGESLEVMVLPSTEAFLAFEHAKEEYDDSTNA